MTDKPKDNIDYIPQPERTYAAAMLNWRLRHMMISSKMHERRFTQDPYPFRVGDPVPDVQCSADEFTKHFEAIWFDIRSVIEKYARTIETQRRYYKLDANPGWVDREYEADKIIFGTRLLGIVSVEGILQDVEEQLRAWIQFRARGMQPRAGGEAAKENELSDRMIASFAHTMLETLERRYR